MPGNFTPARVVINKPVPGPKGDQGEPGGVETHTHPEYEHSHPVAAEVHSHPEYEHAHPFASDTHNHDTVYAPIVHPHDYAATNHDHPHDHDGAYSALGHTHDYAATGHNHDGVYAPTHPHPYADADHGAHLTAGQLTDLTDGGTTTLHTHPGGSGSGVAKESHVELVALAVPMAIPI